MISSLNFNSFRSNDLSMMSDEEVRTKANLGRKYRALSLQPMGVLLGTLYILSEREQPMYMLGYLLLGGSFAMVVYLITQSKKSIPAIKELEYRARVRG